MAKKVMSFGPQRSRLSEENVAETLHRLADDFAEEATQSKLARCDHVLNETQHLGTTFVLHFDKTRSKIEVDAIEMVLRRLVENDPR